MKNLSSILAWKDVRTEETRSKANHLPFVEMTQKVLALALWYLLLSTMPLLMSARVCTN